MTPCQRCKWSTRSTEEQLETARNATPEGLRRLARGHDWSGDFETVLGWIMAQQSIDLGSALTVFFNGELQRFNYLSKREVPAQWRGAARLFDTICQRINSGYYRMRPGQRVAQRRTAQRWLEFQRADRAEGRGGRWILDEGMVAAALKGSAWPPASPEPEIAALRPRQGAARLLSRLAPPALARRLCRFWPQQG